MELFQWKSIDHRWDNFLVKAIKKCLCGETGGKARGLAELMEIGLLVPEGFALFPMSSAVIENGDADAFSPVIEAYREMGGVPSPQRCGRQRVRHSHGFQHFRGAQLFRDGNEGTVGHIRESGCGQYSGKITAITKRFYT